MSIVQDIASDMLEKLRKLHIDSVSQLAVQNPRELAIEINDDADVSSDIDSASKLITSARKLLTEHGILSKEFSTADYLLAKRNKITRYTVGSDKFDAFLNGGFETQAVTEIAGEYGSGKSQICHTLCLAANKLGDDTIADDNNKQTTDSIIFIDTENTFRADRVYQIAEQNGLDPETILTRIYHCRIYNSLELELVINNLGKSIEQYNAKLVIVDSIISLHRAEFSGRETLAQRQQRPGKLLNKLRSVMLNDYISITPTRLAGLLEDDKVSVLERALNITKDTKSKAKVSEFNELRKEFKQPITNKTLTGINLESVIILHSNLSNTNLENSQLTNVQISGDVSNINLRYANLSNADLTNAVLVNADLRNADLDNADLTSAYLLTADLSNADLDNADLTNAYLGDADLTSAGLTNASLTNADLSFQSRSNKC